MSDFSNFLEKELLDQVLRAEAWVAPSSVWIALFTADNGLETNVQIGEVATGGYTRMEIGGSSGRSFLAATGSPGATDNADVVTFPTATAGWGTITHTAIMSASTAGEVLIHGLLTLPKTVVVDDIVKFAVGDFDISLD